MFWANAVPSTEHCALCAPPTVFYWGTVDNRTGLVTLHCTTRRRKHCIRHRSHLLRSLSFVVHDAGAPKPQGISGSKRCAVNTSSTENIGLLYYQTALIAHSTHSCVPSRVISSVLYECDHIPRLCFSACFLCMCGCVESLV